MKTRNRIIALSLCSLLATSGATAIDETESAEPESIDTLIEQFREGQEARVEERRALAESLRDSDRDERERAMRDLILEQTAEQRELGQRIRELMKEEALRRNEAARGREVREARPAAADTEVADLVRELNDEFRTERDALLTEWRATVDELREESPEVREAAFQDFRDQLTTLREERRDVAEAARQRAEERRDRSAE